MLKKVLLLSASAGAGHVRAAEAIEKAFKQLPAGDSIEVHHLDILNYTNKVFRHVYSKAYIDLVNKLPEVPGWVYDKLEARRIPADKITVSGIPIDPVFAQHKDKHAMRAKHGLAPDRTTILLSAGGFGVGSVDALITSLLPLQHRAQIVAICGRNTE